MDLRRWHDRPLLPPAARRPAAVLLACCAAFTAIVGILSAGLHRGIWPDQGVDSWLVSLLGAHRPALQLITDIGTLGPVTVLTVIVAAVCLVRRRLNGALLAVVGVPLAAVLTERVLKPLVQQRIFSFLSYPSGRATGLTALAATLAVLLLLYPASGRPRPAVRIALVAVALLVDVVVAVGVVAIQYHYFTDTVAGAAVGTGVVLATAFLLDWAYGRVRGSGPPADRAGS